MAAAPPTPKKQKINEAGDRIATTMSETSHNDKLEEIEALDEEALMRQLVDLSFRVKNQNQAPVSRSDFSKDWRRQDPAVTRFPAYDPKNTVPKFLAPAIPKKQLVLTGPNEEKIKRLVDRTGYTLTVSPRQRTYGGPPPNWTGSAPTNQCQVFVGKVPKQIFEDELVPLFEKTGRIYEMRIMMEGAPSIISRGFAFVVFTTPAEARRAERQLDNYEIMPGYFIKVAVSEPICRLFLCQIPKHVLLDKDVEREISSQLAGVQSIEYKAAKGFAFVTFKDHVSAAQAKKVISNGTVKLFKVKVGVDFADQIPEPDAKSMSDVKAVHVTGFRSWITEAELVKLFESCGNIDKVKKLPGYAFIHFRERSGAVNAIQKFHNQQHQYGVYRVTLAKPPLDPGVKEEALIRRAKRLENQRKGCYTGPQSQHLLPPFRGQVSPKE